jgi:hypothetical protein
MRAKLLLAFFSVVILFGVVGSVDGQKRVMVYKEADAIISASRRLLMDTPNRQIYSEEKFAATGAKAEPTKMFLTEEIPSKANRSLRTTWLENGQKDTKEFVYVDGKAYRRTNDGEWDTSPMGKSLIAPPLGNSDSIPVQTKNQAWFIEEVTENGRKIKVYEIKNSYTYLEKRVRTTYVATVRHWIRDDGLTIRRVSENTVVGKPQITKGVWEFEYENIEIQAPTK